MTLYLPAIKEKVRLYEGKIRISQEDECRTPVRDLWVFAREDGKSIPITGKIELSA